MFDVPSQVKARLRVMQIIASALLVGPLIFLVIAVVLVNNRGGQGFMQQQADALPMVTLIAIGLLVVYSIVGMVIPGVMEKNSLQRIAKFAPNTFVMPPVGRFPGGPIDDLNYLLGTYQTSMIVSMAIFEGGAFLGAMAYLLEGRFVAIVVVFIALGIIVMRFPTESRVLNWLERQRLQLENLRRDNGTLEPH